MGLLMKIHLLETSTCLPWYKLDLIKVKSRWTNGGATLSLGAVGQQIQVSTQARIYLKGTSIRDIIFPRYSGRLKVGIQHTFTRDSLKNLILLNDIIKEAGEDDFVFLEQKNKAALLYKWFSKRHSLRVLGCSSI